MPHHPSSPVDGRLITPCQCPFPHLSPERKIMATSPLDTSDTPFGATPRPLADEVLQTAEEAVLSNPDAVEILPEQGSAHVLKPAAPHAPSESATQRLARQVADKPYQAALLALVAGALVTLLLQTALQRRQQ